MFSTRTIIAALAAMAIAPAVSAHMEMTYPPGFRHKANPNVPAAQIDYTQNSPLDGSGSNYPCKGWHKDFTTDPDGAGAPSVTWAAGSSQTLQTGGTAIHGGGSCQLSLSYDGGNTFIAFKSYHGNCPATANAAMPFTVPSDAPAGRAIFSWTWFNAIGFREMYMACASVEIENSGDSSSFSSRPTIFVANVNNGCGTTENTDVEFPNPGPDVVVAPSSFPLTAPTGTCGGAAQPAPNVGGGLIAEAKPTTEDTEAVQKTASTEEAPASTEAAPATDTPPTPAASATTGGAAGSGKKCVRRKKRSHAKKNFRRHSAPLRGSF